MTNREVWTTLYLYSQHTAAIFLALK